MSFSESATSASSNVEDDRKIFVGGLSWDTTEKDLREYFTSYGTVLDCVLKVDQATGRSRGFGFVLFEDSTVVDTVLSLGHTLQGRTITPKKTKIMNREGGGRGGGGRGGGRGGGFRGGYGGGGGGYGGGGYGGQGGYENGGSYGGYGGYGDQTGYAASYGSQGSYGQQSGGYGAGGYGSSGGYGGSSGGYGGSGGYSQY